MEIEGKTYEEFIQDIINGRGRFACGDEYCERHHIIPKCMGGTNDKGNLIDLYAREHFIAHKLLALENPDNVKLQYAWWCMCNIKGKDDQDRYIPTPEEYEEARIICSKTHAENIMGHFVSEETKNKIRETHTGFGNPNSRSVLCVETNEMMCIREFERKYGVSHSSISRCCIGEMKYAGRHPVTNEKLHWMYMDDKEINKSPKQIDSHKNSHKKEMKCIVQLDLDNTFINEFNGIREMQRILGYNRTPIINCCKHKPNFNTAYGFKWMYKDEYEALNNHEKCLTN